MLSNMPTGMKLLVGFGSRIVFWLLLVVAAIYALMQVKDNAAAVERQVQVFSLINTMAMTINEGMTAATYHARTGYLRYGDEVTRLAAQIDDQCEKVLEIMVAPANRERVGTIRGYVRNFKELDDVLAGLNQDFATHRATRVTAAAGVYSSLNAVLEAVQGAATTGAQNVVAEVDGTMREVEYVNRDRMRAVERIAIAQRHFGLARVAATNFEVALGQADRDRYWGILESEIRNINNEVRSLEAYVVSPGGRQALADLSKFAGEWQTASSGIGDTIRRRAANSAEIELLSNQINDLLAQIVTASNDRVNALNANMNALMNAVFYAIIFVAIIAVVLGTVFGWAVEHL